MDHARSTSGNGEDNAGIPEDLRCKRSDGKQWRCSAKSMPDKTVCEKHYIQAKKRAANSALRASLRKAKIKRKYSDESDLYLESKDDDLDMPPVNKQVNKQVEDYPLSQSGKKYKEKVPKSELQYSPETPPVRSLSTHNTLGTNDGSQRDFARFEEDQRSYKTPTPSALDSSRIRSQRISNASPMEDSSDGSTDSSDDNGGRTCHQCRRNDKDRVVWCHRCDRRGYCFSCISTWYLDISLEEIQRVCPACRGTCNCKVCLRGDNFIKVRIREIPVQDKLQYLHCLLSSVLPVVKQIHYEQCSEVELEKRLRGTEIDLARTKLNADEQMCCNFCRMPIIDYHRHCVDCTYDLCISCCKDVREASISGVEGEVVQNKTSGRSQDIETISEHVKLSRLKLNLSDKFPDWKTDSDDSIPCPPREYGGCGCSSLTLCRIFKMNWVAKLVKNAEEMVSGCKVYDACSPQNIGSSDSRLCQYAYREDNCENYLYCPASDDIKGEGIGNFRNHWIRGEPVIVKQVCDSSSTSGWDPMVIWKGIRETTAEKMKEESRTVKAIDCLNWSEVDIELGQFVKGYSEGRIHDNGWPEMLKLKDWPSPSASEEFLSCQKPEFISKLPLLEYIHSKWGLLNVAAKLPHYSLQDNVGPKIFISYGTYEELGRGDSVTNLHFNMSDMVYVLVHATEVKLGGWQRTNIEKIHDTYIECEAKQSPEELHTSLDKESSLYLSLGRQAEQNEHEPKLDVNEDNKIGDQGVQTTSGIKEKTVDCEVSNRDCGNTSEKTRPGALWDVFRRQDVPKLIEYLRVHWKEFGKPDIILDHSVTHPLYDEVVFLSRHHKIKLKEEFGVEPWSFEQYLGQAVFIPAGCPFQMRNLQSTVQLGLEFLSPESLGEAIKLSEGIRCLPNDHGAKIQMLEVGKISLYAASSAIREIQKLVLDPKLGSEIGFDDPNLTAMVSENLDKMVKRRSVTCA